MPISALSSVMKASGACCQRSADGNTPAIFRLRLNRNCLTSNYVCNIPGRHINANSSDMRILGFHLAVIARFILSEEYIVVEFRVQGGNDKVTLGYRWGSNPACLNFECSNRITNIT